MIIGASFSHKHLQGLNLEPFKSLNEFSSLGLEWIRLGCYWSEIEKTPGKYDFSKLKNLLSFCQKKKIKVALTVGMKAPRWPEYYLPEWLTKKTNLKKFAKIDLGEKDIVKPLFSFIKNTVLELSPYSCLKVWQVENEPLEPTGEKKWRITKKLLAEEIRIVREIDKKRPISLIFSGLVASLPFFWKNIAKIDFDILGLDIYFKRPLGSLFYTKNFSKGMIKRLIAKAKRANKKVWISELQAEPWKPKELVSSKENPPSFLPQDFKKNFNEIINWGGAGIFLWGFEYWLWKKERGDERYWAQGKKFLASI